MLAAFIRRHNAQIRQDRYASSITASVVANSNRASNDDYYWYPEDFVLPPDPEAERLRNARNAIKEYVSMSGMMSGDKFEIVRAKVLARLSEQGYSDPVALFDSVFARG